MGHAREAEYEFGGKGESTRLILLFFANEKINQKEHNSFSVALQYIIAELHI